MPLNVNLTNAYGSSVGRRTVNNWDELAELFLTYGPQYQTEGYEATVRYVPSPSQPVGMIESFYNNDEDDKPYSEEDLYTKDEEISTPATFGYSSASTPEKNEEKDERDEPSLESVVNDVFSLLSKAFGQKS